MNSVEVYEDSKKLLLSMLKDLNSNDKAGVKEFLKFLINNFPTENELILLEKGVNESYNVTKSQGGLIEVGFSKMLSIYLKLKSYYKGMDKNVFNPCVYFYNNVQLTLRNFIRGGSKEDVKLPYMTKINNELIVMFMSYTWATYILENLD